MTKKSRFYKLASKHFKSDHLDHNNPLKSCNHCGVNFPIDTSSITLCEHLILHDIPFPEVDGIDLEEGAATRDIKGKGKEVIQAVPTLNDVTNESGAAASVIPIIPNILVNPLKRPYEHAVPANNVDDNQLLQENQDLRARIAEMALKMQLQERELQNAQMEQQRLMQDRERAQFSQFSQIVEARVKQLEARFNEQLAQTKAQSEAQFKEQLAQTKAQSEAQFKEQLAQTKEQLAQTKAQPEALYAELQAKVEHEFKRQRYTITTASELGISVIKIAKIDLHHFQYLFLHSSGRYLLDEIVIPHNFNDLPVNSEAQVQKKFMIFLNLLTEKLKKLREHMDDKTLYYTQKANLFNSLSEVLKTERVFKDTSVSSYLKNPIAKIGISVLDGSQSLWSSLITFIELKDSLTEDHKYHDVLGQLMDRFTNIFDQQSQRQYVLAAACGASQIEFLWKHRNGELIRSGILQLDWDINSPYLCALVNMVIAAADVVGYRPLQKFAYLCRFMPDFKFEKFLHHNATEKRTSIVLLGKMNDEMVIFKAFNSDHECKVLSKLSSCKYVPQIIRQGTLDDELSFMVIRPFGELLEAQKHGVKIVLNALQDVCKTLKFAQGLGILHRDVSFGNIVVYEQHGYLIDWGAASDTQIGGHMTATLMFASLRVLQRLAYAPNTDFTYTISDDIESLYYTLIYIACDGNVQWKRGMNAADGILAWKCSAIHNFDHILERAHHEFHPSLRKFYNILFDGQQRRDVNIDDIINTFSELLA